MTERLYYRDADLLAFDATVLRLDGDDPCRVILDRTAFYPTSGGQPHDLGTLGGIAVLEVSDAGDAIVHHLAAALPAGPVRGTVDALRRRDHMQQHSAQHLLSALAADAFGWQTVSVHFGAASSTIEVTAGAVGDTALRELEARANAVVAEARPVTVSFEEAGEAMERGLRAAPSRAGDIRVVTIAGIDRSACGGTHVALTSAIGPVHLIGTEKVRGHVRIEFVAGARVMTRLRRLGDEVAQVAAALGCAPAEIAALLPRRLEEGRAARERLAALEEDAAAGMTAQLVAATAPGADGLRHVVHRGNERPEILRQMAAAAAAQERVLFIGLSAQPGGTALTVGASADSGHDAGALVKRAMAALGGKGGGSPRVAQGSAPADADRVLAQLP